MWDRKDNYKVFVTKDFPRIYEQRVHFEKNDISGDTAIVREGYGRDDPYVGDTYTRPVVLNPGEWFWSFEDAKVDWNKRRQKRITQKLVLRAEINVEIKELYETNDPTRDDVESGEFCEPYPDGKEAQVERHSKFRREWERKVLEEDIARQKETLERDIKRLKKL